MKTLNTFMIHRLLALTFFCLLLTIFFPAPSFAFPYKRVTVQPIQITNDSDLGPQVMLFEEELDKIWAQAGIDINFLPVTKFISGLDLQASLEELQPSISGYPNNWIVTPPSFFSKPLGQNIDPTVLNMWFVYDILGGFGGTILGVSNSSYQIVGNNLTEIYDNNGIVISDDSYAASPMFEVLAHEIGHNLGLSHVDLGYGSGNYDPTNLMSANPYHPESAYNIFPDGLRYCELTSQQIEIARSSRFALELNQVPEPATMLLLSLGLIGLAGIRRKFQK